MISCPLPSFLVAWSILVSRLSVSNDTPKGSHRFSAARLGVKVVYHRCLLQAASIFALRPCSLLDRVPIKNSKCKLQPLDANNSAGSTICSSALSPDFKRNFVLAIA